MVTEDRCCYQGLRLTIRRIRPGRPKRITSRLSPARRSPTFKHGCPPVPHSSNHHGQKSIPPAPRRYLEIRRGSEQLASTSRTTAFDWNAEDRALGIFALNLRVAPPAIGRRGGCGPRLGATRSLRLTVSAVASVPPCLGRWRTEWPSSRWAAANRCGLCGRSSEIYMLVVHSRSMVATRRCRRR